MKYDLMILNQDLGRVVPSSKLSEELTFKMAALQEEISKLEKELSEKPQPKESTQELTGVRRLREEDGKVRIWSSSSG